MADCWIQLLICVDGGQSAEPRLIDLLEQRHAAGDKRRREAGPFDRGRSGVARWERSTLRPGAAIVVADAPPIAEPSRWALDSRLPERSVAVTLIVPATIAAKPFALLAGEAVAGRRDDGDVHGRELPDQLGDALAVSAIVGEPVLGVIPAVGQRHVDRR